MRKITSLAGFAVVLCIAISSTTTSVSAQQKQRVSPHETISAVLDKTNRVTVVYGRPYTKDPKTGEMRKIWGGLVPNGKIWRVGADEATLLITQQPTKLGDTVLPAGAHTLFVLPAENGPSKLVVNKQLGQWGLTYDEKQDVARVDMKKDPLDPAVHQFTMAVERNPAGGGVLKLMWEDTQFSVPLATQK